MSWYTGYDGQEYWHPVGEEREAATCTDCGESATHACRSCGEPQCKDCFIERRCCFTCAALVAEEA